MTLKDLYIRIKDSTGLEVLTVSDMYTIYKNCTADLTSRGYREFAELHVMPTIAVPVEETTYFTNYSNKKFVLTSPANLRKLLYVKVEEPNGVHKAYRIPVTHPNLDTVTIGEEHFFDFNNAGGLKTVFYIKDTQLIIETSVAVSPKQITLGYYKKIEKDIIPESFETIVDGQPVTSTDVYDPAVLETITLPIREDLEDCFVFYGIYFTYNKRLKEDAMITRHLNNYKYLVEDLLHELKYEDNFNEEESVIALDN